MTAAPRILVPGDFSPCSTAAVEQACTLAQQVHGTIELLHVLDDPIASGAWASEVYAPSYSEVLEQMIADARQRLAALKAGVAAHGITVTAVTLVGSPTRSILAHAAAGGFSTIVMGTHGRTGVAHLFLGSVAERVVRRAPCPVMTVRDRVAA